MAQRMSRPRQSPHRPCQGNGRPVQTQIEPDILALAQIACEVELEGAAQLHRCRWTALHYLRQHQGISAAAAIGLSGTPAQQQFHPPFPTGEERRAQHTRYVQLAIAHGNPRQRRACAAGSKHEGVAPQHRKSPRRPMPAQRLAALQVQREQPMLFPQIGMSQYQIVVHALHEASQSVQRPIVGRAFQMRGQRDARLQLPREIVHEQSLDIGRHFIAVAAEEVLEQRDVVVVEALRLTQRGGRPLVAAHPSVFGFGAEAQLHAAQKHVGAVLLVLVHDNPVGGREIEEHVPVEAIAHGHVHGGLGNRGVFRKRQIVDARLSQYIVAVVQSMALSIANRHDGVGSQLHFLGARFEKLRDIFQRLGT